MAEGTSIEINVSVGNIRAETRKVAISIETFSKIDKHLLASHEISEEENLETEK